MPRPARVQHGDSVQPAREPQPRAATAVAVAELPAAAARERTQRPTSTAGTAGIPVADVARVSDLPAADVVAAPSAPPAHGLGSGGVISLADFEDVFERFQTPITNFIIRLVGNREQGYDLAQDVFVKVYRALAAGTTVQSGALSSWLYRVASNTATDALRRKRLIAWLPLSLFNDDRGVGAGVPGAEPTQLQGVGGEETLAALAGTFAGGYDGGRFEQHVADNDVVATVLAKLPEKYATCLLLYEHEGFSCAEIADMLHISASAVKMRLMRARERFIALYQQETGAL